MVSLAGLLEMFDDDPVRRGRQFEELCVWFLANDPMYRHELREIWRWKEWPGRWGPDAGIDLVAEDHRGDLWAVQCKAYDPLYAVTKADVDSFLSESNRPQFSYRLLIATTDRIGSTARRTLEGQEKQVGFLGLTELEMAGLDWPKRLNDLKPSPRRPKKPRPHQRSAVTDVVRGFDLEDRGQLVMACGTGKTLTSLAIAERIDATRSLVLLPSLSLLSQTLREWVANATSPFVPLAVCSDDTVADRDAVVATTSHLGMPVTTEPETIASFLRCHGQRVVFATYQSSPRIAQAFRLGKVPAFDLVVADEAHRCAGRVSSDFATVLDAAAIPARRRLFMTATPRYFTGKVLREAKEADFEVASMDDRGVFGPVLHRLTFSEAIAKGLLSDYQVVVIGVDDGTYRAWVDRGQLLTLDGQSVVDARTLAGQIGMAKAIRDHGLRRCITFHSRVAPARRFARTLPEVIAWMPENERPQCSVWADLVSGEMSAGERNIILRRLRVLDDGQAGVLTNARCLAEGVDVANLDGVAFIDPRRSEVEIVQAVGRAIRKAEDKVLGTVVIPVFIGAGDDAEILLEDSAFRPVWDVLKALRAHDENLANELDGLRRELGRGARSLPLPSKIHLDLPTTAPASFAAAFNIKAVEATTRPWEFWFGLLERYADEHGHARVPNEEAYGGHLLGGWVREQRVHYRKGRMNSERLTRLEAVAGWTWDPFADDWQRGFDALRRYIEIHGHGRIHDDLVEGDFAIGKWVTKQRMASRSGRLDAERQRTLDECEGWSWEPREDRWEEGFGRLLAWTEKTGSAACSGHELFEGFKLGQWCGVNRTMRHQGQLPDERARRLEALPGWSWQPRIDTWEPGFAHLRDFAEREGHCRVPQKRVEPDGFKLGQWVQVQRTEYSKGRLRSERSKRLEALPGWHWAPHEADWEAGFRRLVQYVSEQGHARPRQRYVDATGFKLGTWVSLRRREGTTGRLATDKVAALEVLPGWVWDTRQPNRDAGYEHLLAFMEREGHSRVPTQHIEGDFRLGQWVNNAQARHKHGRLAVEQAERLEALPGWVWRA